MITHQYPSLQHVILSTHAGVLFRRMISSDDQTRNHFLDPACRITVAYVNKI